MTPTVADRHYLKPLTGLRFLAALHVVLFHMQAPYLLDAPAWLLQLVRMGYYAVGLFFVLSGFILTYTYLGMRGSAGIERRRFFAARFARIYPTYLFSLLVAAPVFFISSLKNGSEGHEITNVALAVITVPSMIQAWSPLTALAWNIPAWSLSVEAFFYVLFPFVAPILGRLVSRQLLGLMIATWGVALGIHMTFSIGLGVPTAPEAGVHDSWAAVLLYHPLVRLPEFVIGIMLGHVFLRGGASTRLLARAQELRASALACLAMGTLVLAYIASKLLPQELIGNALFIPLFAFLIYGLSASRSGLSWILSHPIMQLLGESSFALYLIHMPVWHLILAISNRIPSGNEFLEQRWILIVYLSLIIGASIGTYWLVERPSRRLLFSILSRRAEDDRLDVGGAVKARGSASGRTAWLGVPSRLQPATTAITSIEGGKSTV